MSAQLVFDLAALEPQAPVLPLYVPSGDPFRDLCHRAFHGRTLARDERGRVVCASCGQEVRP